jgi:hypothetical protein
VTAPKRATAAHFSSVAVDGTLITFQPLGHIGQDTKAKPKIVERVTFAPVLGPYALFSATPFAGNQSTEFPSKDLPLGAGRACFDNHPACLPLASI